VQKTALHSPAMQKKKTKTKNEPIISAYLKLPSFSICVPELKVPVNRSTEIPTRADL